MAEEGTIGGPSNRENNSGLEKSDSQGGQGNPVDTSPDLGLDDLLSWQPEERRNIMAAIANSLGSGLSNIPVTSPPTSVIPQASVITPTLVTPPTSVISQAPVIPQVFYSQHTNQEATVSAQAASLLESSQRVGSQQEHASMPQFLRMTFPNPNEGARQELVMPNKGMFQGHGPGMNYGFGSQAFGSGQAPPNFNPLQAQDGMDSRVTTFPITNGGMDTRASSRNARVNNSDQFANNPQRHVSFGGTNVLNDMNVNPGAYSNVYNFPNGPQLYNNLNDMHVQRGGLSQKMGTMNAPFYPNSDRVNPYYGGPNPANEANLFNNRAVANYGPNGNAMSISTPSPFVTNDRYMGDTVYNEAWNSQMQDSDVMTSCNNNRGMPSPQTTMGIPLPSPMLTPIEREVKELKEMLLRFVNKDGMDLQALNSQDMAVLPQKFKMPDIKRFNGTDCPISHLKSYTLAMKTRGATPQLMAANFPLTLEGAALEWIMTLDPTILINWDKVSKLFQKRYGDNSKRGNDKKELKNFSMKEGESFTEFARRWKDKVAQTLERPTKDEEMDMFLNNLRPFYFHKMVCGVYSGFDALMAAGLRMEECLRLGTMKDDTPASGSSHRYRSNTTEAANKASNSLPTSNSISNISWPSQTGPSSSSQHRAQIPYNCVNAVNNGNNNQRGGMTNDRPIRPKRTYDVLPASRANIFKWLKEEGVAKPLEGWKPKLDPLPSNWDHGKFCEYHNHSGHTTGKCLSLKKYLQNLIGKGVLERGMEPGDDKHLVVRNPLHAKQVGTLQLEGKRKEEEMDPIVVTKHTPSLPAFVTPLKERKEKGMNLDCDVITRGSLLKKRKEAETEEKEEYAQQALLSPKDMSLPPKKKNKDSNNIKD